MSRSKLLHSYWLTFEPPVHSKLGVGVTAYSLEDAVSLVGATVGGASPPLVAAKEDVQFSDLDQNHVVPNMLPMIDRGVWYPKLGALR